jgi:hypothetical protein
LVIANVVNIRDVQAVSSMESMGYNVDTEENRDVIINERTALLEEMLEKASIDRENVKAVFRVGHPLDKLLQIIEEEKIDMWWSWGPKVVRISNMCWWGLWLRKCSITVRSHCFPIEQNRERSIHRSELHPSICAEVRVQLILLQLPQLGRNAVTGQNE